MAIRKNTGIEMSSCSGVSIEPKACSEFHVQIVLTVNREFTFETKLVPAHFVFNYFSGARAHGMNLEKLNFCDFLKITKFVELVVY